VLAVVVGSGVLAGAGRADREQATTGEGRSAVWGPSEGGGVAGSSELRGLQRGSRASPWIAPPPSSGDSTARGGFAPDERERRVDRTASRTLAAQAERLERISDGVVAVTDRRRGSSSARRLSRARTNWRRGASTCASADELRATLTDLAALGGVRAQQSGEDVTLVASIADRLAAVREGRGLLRRLERTDTDRAASPLRR